MNSKGEIIIEVEYQDYLPINQNEGITVKKDGNWGIIDFAGNELIPFSYKNIPIISEGLVRLHNNDTDKFGFTDISNPQIKSYDYDMAYAYSEGVSMVMKNEKWGGIDKSNNVVIPFKFDDMKSFSNGLASAKYNGYWGCIDKETNIIIDFKFEDPIQFNESGIASAKVDGGYTVIDKSGNKLIDNIFDKITVDEKLPIIYYVDNDQFGMINLETKKIILVMSDKMFSDKLCPVYDDSMDYYYIDSNGEKITEYKYFAASSYENGYALVIDKKYNCYLIDKKGNHIKYIKDNVQSISELINGTAIIRTLDDIYYVLDFRNNSQEYKR